MAARTQGSTGLFRVTEGFGVPSPEGFVIPYPAGTLVRGDDPIASSHAHMMEPADNGAVEAATAAPGERRNVRLPSGRSVQDVTRHREGHAHKTATAPRGTGGTTVPFRDSSITPEDPRHPASTFAPTQPAAGVVAPDVPDEQNPAGGPKPDAVSTEQAQAYVDSQNSGGPGTVEEPAAPPVDEKGEEKALPGEEDTDVSDEERQAGNILSSGGEASGDGDTAKKAASRRGSSKKSEDK